MATISGIVTFTNAELAALAKLVAPLISAAPVTPPVVTPPVVIPPVITSPTPSGTAWIYNDALIWSKDLMNYGDYVYDYQDTTGKPPVGTHDIMVTGTQGGFQPGTPGLSFDTTGYNFLIVSLKSVQADDFQVGGMSSDGDGDTSIPGAVNADLAQFADKPFTAGQWSNCKVPLHAGGLNWPVGLKLRKIGIQSQVAAPTGGKKIWWICNLGLTP